MFDEDERRELAKLAVKGRVAGPLSYQEQNRLAELGQAAWWRIWELERQICALREDWRGERCPDAVRADCFT